MQKNNLAPPLQLAVIVDSMHPRVVYTLETMVQEFLGMALHLVDRNDAASIDASIAQGMPVCSYLLDASAAAVPAFPCNGLLYESHIRSASQRIDWQAQVAQPAFLCREDSFARAFVCLSQYDLLQPDATIAFDSHGRYPDSGGTYTVHQCLAEISAALEPLLGSRLPARAFDFEITIDVDQPWKYLHKPWWVQWGGLFKDFLRGGDWKERWRVLRGNQPDPFSVLEQVQAICPRERTKLFFLVGGSHPNDTRFDLDMAAYRDLVLQWKAAGFEIGIHPSYETWNDAALMKAQKESLEAVAGPVRISRQHYLRYRNPETFRQLIDLGIQYDYSLCCSSHAGAPTGVLLPYRWFDLQRNVATDLHLVPAMAMDRSLQQYQGLSPTAAQELLAACISDARALGGKFVLILHNETFGESGEWQGWLPLIRETVQLLKG